MGTPGGFTGGGRETTVYAIGRCPVAGCRTIRRHQFPGRVVARRRGDLIQWGIPTEHGVVGARPTLFRNATPGAVVGNCWPPGLGRDELGPVASRHIAHIEAMLSLGWVCLEHDRYATVAEVAGEHAEGVSCDERCVNAVSAKCRCSCGGVNHGSVWDQPAGDEPSTLFEQDGS